MLIGALYLVAENYSRWRTHYNTESSWWFMSALLAIFVALYFFATRYLVPINSSNIFFLTWSRHILIVAVFLIWVVLGYRTLMGVDSFSRRFFNKHL